MTHDELVAILTEKYDYPISYVDQVANKIEEFEPIWRKAFEKFIKYGTFADDEIHGYSIAKLIGEMELTPVAAFLTMDQICKNPEKTIKMLKRGIK